MRGKGKSDAKSAVVKSAVSFHRCPGLEVQVKAYFSPLRLWTLEERQKMGAAMKNQSTMFGRRAMTYLYILSRDEDPAQMPEKESQLRILMQTWKDGLGADRGLKNISTGTPR